MRRNKLYTVNKWNRPAFMGDKTRQNIFLPGGPLSGLSPQQMANLKAFNLSANMTPTLSSGAGLSSLGNVGGVASLSETDPTKFFGLDAAGAATGGAGKGLLSNIGSGLGSMGLGMVGGIANQALSSLIGGGLHSGAGDAIGSIGNTVGNMVSKIPGVGLFAGPAVQTLTGAVGGAVNRLWGSELNEKKIAEIEEKQKKKEEENNALYGAKNTAGLTELAGNLSAANNFTKGDIGEEGVFNDDVSEKYRQLKAEEERLGKLQELALANATDNVNENNFLTSARNFVYGLGGPLFATGGHLFSGGGDSNEMNNAYVPQNNSFENMAAYGGNVDTNREKKDKMTNLFIDTPSTFFNFGGDLQTHGGDYPTGLTHISAGGSHEENPYDGVQMGVDQEGTPNLVEEGETVYDDYVFSNRILADEATKKLFRLPKKKDVTFADISKRLEKEIAERPNDPISEAGFKAQMQTLQDQQERQKQEMEAERAKAAFEALSPEEQVAVMEGAAQQEAMAEQAAMQQPSPEEIAIAQQQQTMADGTEAMVGQEPQMNCFGGRINRFDNGGQAYTKMLNSLGFHTQKEFDDWAKENSIDFGDIWKDNPNTLSIDILGKLWSNGKFKEALKKKNPALAHAFETKGYDFGTYVPTSNSRATIQSISKGNWKATNGQGWFGSEDLAFKQATEGMSEDEIKALTTEQLAERMVKTDAYKNTNKWLENSDNALMYLNTLLNDPDTPDVAKKHALQYVKDGKWKDGYKYKYNDVFGKVRSTNPGTYWHTAMEANRGNEANNFVINEDGSIEPILGNVPTDWTSAGNYSWADENSDYTYNYYKRPAVAAKPEAAKTPEEKEAEETTKNLAPKRSWEGLRYAGLFGPAVGLGMMAAGVGKPDYSELNAAVNNAGKAYLATYKPIGNYLTYRPMDIWFEQNRMDANARATDRAIQNNAAPIGTKMAGLLASGYNNQIANGQLYRSALEYNDAKRERVAAFNRDTDKYNADAFTGTSRFNASALNEAEGRNLNARLHAASEKLNRDAGWYNSIYGNVAGLFRGLSDLGRENAQMNMIARGAADGVYGNLGDSYTGQRVIKKAAKGGRLKKGKRGLTY